MTRARNPLRVFPSAVPAVRRFAALGLLASALAGCAWGPSIAPQSTPLAAPAMAVQAPPPLTVGERFTYTEINGFNRLPRATVVREVVATGAETRIATRTQEGKPIDLARLAGGILREGMLNDRAYGPLEPGLELRPFPLAAGQTWHQVTRRADPIWKENRPVRVDGVVRGWETIKVPAGEFKALKIERRMYLGDWDPFRRQTERFEEEWYSPELGVPVRFSAREWYQENTSRFPARLLPGDWFVQELTGISR